MHNHQRNYYTTHFSELKVMVLRRFCPFPKEKWSHKGGYVLFIRDKLLDENTGQLRKGCKKEGGLKIPKCNPYLNRRLPFTIVSSLQFAINLDFWYSP